LLITLKALLPTCFLHLLLYSSAAADLKLPSFKNLIALWNFNNPLVPRLKAILVKASCIDIGLLANHGNLLYSFLSVLLISFTNNASAS